MAGGTFNPLVGKERPGTYINFESSRNDMVGLNPRGTALVPLLDHDYGPAGEFITIEAARPDGQRSKLGHSVFDIHPSMLLIREAFKNASRVLAYIPRQGARAAITVDGLTATARFGGKRGNDLRFSVIENPGGDFDVNIYLESTVQATYEELHTIEELIAIGDPWIEFSGEGPLFAIAGKHLEGGAVAELVISDIVQMLDKSEHVRWNSMAFPLEASETVEEVVVYSLLEALRMKIRYFRNDTGKYRTAAVANFHANEMGIINVTNSVVLNGGITLTPAQATAWVAGADAGASNTESKTHRAYEGAISIVGIKDHPTAVAAIRAGEFFFSLSEEDRVIVEFDINSLTDFNAPRDRTYRLNRIRRVFDTFAEAVMLNFPPNRFDNSPTGWEIMEGLGRELLELFENVGAIMNVDLDADFRVDRTSSFGVETYFDVGLQAVGSAEKLFFSIRTR